MKAIRVKLGNRSYHIYVGTNVIRKLRSVLNIKDKNTPVFVISNKKILKYQGKPLKKALKNLSSNITFHTVPDSETAKSFGIYRKAAARLSKKAKKTTPLVIAFGGGVVGDLTGFVASTYRRGVPYVQIPTTLLAQVDSAIGGKVALDIKEAKNIIGSFYQPRAVFCDLALLDSLPEKEIKNGLVEVIKYGVIKDPALFTIVEKNLGKILKRDRALLEFIVRRACAIKARVVEADEFDTRGVRAILNFGHTFGHAIEASASYRKSVSHGEAVARGMVMASGMAMELGLLSKKDYNRIKLLVHRIKGKKGRALNVKKLLASMAFDKKFTKGTNKFILPKKIGSVTVLEKVPENFIKKAVEGGRYGR